MTDPYNSLDDDTVVDFKRPDKRKFEHIDSSTVVERLEMTDDLRAEFEAAGITIKENDE